ncbi:MAG: hypothetical protein M3178_16380 [Pseudomonadota bacterium]|nr:hypothetical protein [Pseudomonadota bacterium]
MGSLYRLLTKAKNASAAAVLFLRDEADAPTRLDPCITTSIKERGNGEIESTPRNFSAWPMGIRNFGMVAPFKVQSGSAKGADDRRRSALVPGDANDLIPQQEVEYARDLYNNDHAAEDG